MISSVDEAAALFPAVRSQGTRGTCVAFATSAAHEHACLSETLSTEHAYWCAKQVSPGAYEGTTVEAALAGLSRSGQMTESEWPYGQPEWTAGPPPSEASLCPLPGWQRLPDSGVAGICAALARVGSVVLTMAFETPSWYSVDTQGLIPHDPNNPVIGGHAVLAVGFRGSLGSTAEVLIRNSWGPNWADRGYGWLSEEHLAARLAQGHILELGK